MYIESKSFDLSVVGNEEEILKILENGKGRDFRSFCPSPLWLGRAWDRCKKSKSPFWCNQTRLH